PEPKDPKLVLARQAPIDNIANGFEIESAVDREPEDACFGDGLIDVAGHDVCASHRTLRAELLTDHIFRMVPIEPEFRARMTDRNHIADISEKQPRVRFQSLQCQVVAKPGQIADTD